MLAENLSYLTTFVATTGIAVIGALISYKLPGESKKPVLQILFYQQIFLFSFLIYGIWGNLALRQIVTDVNLNQELMTKLAFFIPLIGIPFLIVSWFMLIKFGYNLNGYKGPKMLVYIYFSGFTLVLATFGFLFQNNYFQPPSKPDVFLVRIFIIVNLIFHLLFFLSFLKPNPGFPENFKLPELKKSLWGYLTCVAVYSLLLWYFNSFHFIYTVISFLVLFAGSAMLPVLLKFSSSPDTIDEKESSGNPFNSFCKDYEISKREAEIVLEICSGKTNKAIAEKLFITLQTVKDHTHRIYTKTQVKSRVQLANLVREKTGTNEFQSFYNHSSKNKSSLIFFIRSRA